MESKRIHKAENIAVSDWFGYKEYKFTVDGRESLIVCPEHPLDGNPWVWRAEFFSAFDWVDRALLERGWHIAYHKVSDMYGNPESVGMLHDFYLTVTEEFALSRRPAIFGFSRGALYAVNYAAAYPDECGILYLDAPVTDVFVCPDALSRAMNGRSVRNATASPMRMRKHFTAIRTIWRKRTHATAFPALSARVMRIRSLTLTAAERYIMSAIAQ